MGFGVFGLGALDLEFRNPGMRGCFGFRDVGVRVWVSGVWGLGPQSRGPSSLWVEGLEFYWDMQGNAQG